MKVVRGWPWMHSKPLLTVLDREPVAVKEALKLA